MTKRVYKTRCNKIGVIAYLYREDKYLLNQIACHENKTITELSEEAFQDLIKKYTERHKFNVRRNSKSG